MLEGDEIQQDANEIVEETSAPQPSSEESQSKPSAEEGVETQAKPEPQAPFHEHPRFKELIEKNRTYEARMAEMERRYQDAVRAQPQPKQEKQVNPFVAKLKEIDPAYAQWAESVEAQAGKAQELEQQLQELKHERLRSQYESAISKMHQDHKVPAEVQPFIKEQLDAMALSGRLRTVDDVSSAYKGVQERFSKLIEGMKRAERASYVTDKSKDASSPSSQPKGKAPSTRNEKGQFTGDRETDFASIVKRALNMSKAESDF